MCCASNQWVLSDGSHGMDGWGSLQKNHVCLSVGSLGLVIAKAHWSSNSVCLSPVSTAAIATATMGAGGRGVIAALESFCTSSYFAQVVQIYPTATGHTLCEMKCLNRMLQLQLPEEPLGWESASCGNCGDRGQQRAVKWPPDIASWGLSTFLCQSRGGIPAYPRKLPCSTTISSCKPIHLGKLLMQLLKLLLFRDCSTEMYSPLGFDFELLAPDRKSVV